MSSIGNVKNRPGRSNSQNNDSDSLDISSVSKGIRRSLKSLFGDGKLPKDVSEEELFAGVLGAEIRRIGGKSATQRYNAVFKLEERAAESVPNKIPSAESAAQKALNFLKLSTDLTSEQASEIKTRAFKASQLDDNRKKLYDRVGQASDKTKAVVDTEAAIRKAYTRLAKMA